MNKKLAISGSILLVLVLYLLISNMKHSGNLPDLPVWDGKADEILITGPSGAIKLFKKEGKWVVGDNAYPADVKAVEAVDNRFKELRLSDLISSKGFYAKYDLTPDKYFEVIIKKGDKIFRKFKIGKKSSTNRHTFVKIDDRPEIYLAEGTFEQVQEKKIDDFRDRDVLRISRDAVSEFSVEYQGREYSFVNEGLKKAGDKAPKKDAAKQASGAVAAKWVCRGFESVQIDKNKMDSLLQPLDPLRALSFPDIQKEALTQRIGSVQVKAYNKEIMMTIFKKDEKYLVATSESPYVFEVEKGSVEKFFLTGIDSLKAPGK
jgi:hypothetical protein